MTEKKGIDRKREIVECVERLISQSGVNDISLSDIARECKISKGTLYYHYSSKDAIILDILDKHMSGLIDDYLSWLKRHDIITKERFLSVIFFKGVNLFGKAKMHLFLINECLTNKTNLNVEFKRLWLIWRDSIKMGVERIFPDCEDSLAYSQMLMLIIEGLALQEALQTDSFDNDRLINIVKK